MFQIRLLAASIAAVVASLLSFPATAEPGFTLQASAFVDDQDGTSYDLNAQFQPSDWLTLSAGAGRSRSSALTTDFNGTAVHGGVDVQRGRFGGGLQASGWEDSDQFTSRILSGRFAVTLAESFEAGVLLESRQLEVGYTTTGLLGRTIPQNLHFQGSGLGAELGWYGRAWSGHLRGIAYDYDTQLDRVIAASRAPATRAFPQLASLVSSVLTRTAGAIDYQASLGVDRAFARSGLGVDLTLSSDTISGDDSASLSVSWRYELSTHLGIDTTLGLTETDGFDSTGFAGLGFSFRN